MAKYLGNGIYISVTEFKRFANIHIRHKRTVGEETVPTPFGVTLIHRQFQKLKVKIDEIIECIKVYIL